MSRRARETTTGSTPSDTEAATDHRRASIDRGLQGQGASWRDLADSWCGRDEPRRGTRRSTSASS